MAGISPKGGRRKAIGGPQACKSGPPIYCCDSAQRSHCCCRFTATAQVADMVTTVGVITFGRQNVVRG